MHPRGVLHPPRCGRGCGRRGRRGGGADGRNARRGDARQFQRSCRHGRLLQRFDVVCFARCGPQGLPRAERQDSTASAVLHNSPNAPDGSFGNPGQGRPRSRPGSLRRQKAQRPDALRAWLARSSLPNPNLQSSPKVKSPFVAPTPSAARSRAWAMMFASTANAPDSRRGVLVAELRRDREVEPRHGPPAGGVEARPEGGAHGRLDEVHRAVLAVDEVVNVNPREAQPEGPGPGVDGLARIRDLEVVLRRKAAEVRLDAEPLEVLRRVGREPQKSASFVCLKTVASDLLLSLAVRDNNLPRVGVRAPDSARRSQGRQGDDALRRALSPHR